MIPKKQSFWCYQLWASAAGAEAEPISPVKFLTDTVLTLAEAVAKAEAVVLDSFAARAASGQAQPIALVLGYYDDVTEPQDPQWQIADGAAAVGTQDGRVTSWL